MNNIEREFFLEFTKKKNCGRLIGRDNKTPDIVRIRKYLISVTPFITDKVRMMHRTWHILHET